MKRFLLDTGPAQDFNNGRNGIRERVDAERHRGNRIGICTPVLGELWSGVEGSQTRDKNIYRLRYGLSRLILWPYDERAAEEFGRIYAELRRIGRPMQQVDVMIAAIALALGNCTVITVDQDLAAIPGLIVDNWAQTNETKPESPTNYAGIERPKSSRLQIDVKDLHFSRHVDF
jgi:tRNA(fMet)-specific endonuclease VapC